MAHKFVTGDIVKLISGGPPMTVRGTHFDSLTNKYKDNIYDCIWFENNKDGKKEVHDRPFSSDELIKAEDTADDEQP